MVNSDFLVAQPSFLTGMARSIDLFGQLTDYNYSETQEKADIRVLMQDAHAIRKDIVAAMRKLEESIKARNGP
ncbi:unnamed protein product [marine sediment metagenome]|uniref:Uncharacterized protein n=1 Tax=marine sediment metagenome TaxID=412755 RepID=X0VPY6_9ZZZZ